MVEAVTSEEFSEFQRDIGKRLKGIDKKLDDLKKRFKENNDKARADFEKATKEIYERIEELEGSSLGLMDRLRDAISPPAAEPPQEGKGPNQIEKTEKTLGKVAEVVRRCPNFFDWDLCQINCPLYHLCDNVSTVQDASRLTGKTSTEKAKDMLKQFITTFDLKTTYLNRR